MIFSRNIINTVLLEAEFKRLKALYSKARELKKEAAVKDLRKEIKLLKAKSNIVSH